MSDINKVILVGRCVKDAELKYTNGGTAVSKISLAVNKTRKQGMEWVKEVSYIDVTIWGKTAESLQQYLTKGKQVGISGELKQDRWEKDGKTNSRLSVVAHEVQLLGSNGGLSPSKEVKTQDVPADDFEDDSIPF